MGSSAAALCRTTTRFTPHHRGTSAAADSWVCGRRAREAPSRRRPCSLAKQEIIGSGGLLGLWAKSAGGAVTEAAMLAGEAGLHAVAPNTPINNPDPEGNPFADN